MNWPVEQYPDYNDLKTAGFSTADWDKLSAFTYGFHISHVSVNDEEGISNAVNKILNYFSSKHGDIVATVSSNFSPARETDYQTQNTIKKISTGKRPVDRQNSSGNLAQLDRKYGTPPIVKDIYYKHKSGVAVNLRIWKKGKYSSGDSRIDNYLENLARSAYGEDSGWGFELSPGWIVYQGAKLQITNDYFELKQVQRGITTIIKVARDLSWVSGYDSMTGKEVLFSQRASKKEYDAWCEAHKKLYNQMQNGGAGSNSTSRTINSSSRSSSHASREMCSKCGGRGYERTSYQYAAASSSGWMPPYHNSGGGSCPYCNYKTDHYHYPCSECRGYGQTKK